MSFGSFSLRELTCMHCVYLALWTRKVLCGSFLCAIYKFSFIHSSIIAVQKVCVWVCVCVCVCVCVLVILVETDKKHSQDVLDRPTHFVLNTHTQTHTHTHTRYIFFTVTFHFDFVKRHTFLNLNSYSILWMQCNHRAFQKVNKLAVLTQVSPWAKSF